MKAKYILLTLARHLAWSAKDKRRITPLTSAWVEGHALGSFATARGCLQVHLKYASRAVQLEVGRTIRHELAIGGAK